MSLPSPETLFIADLHLDARRPALVERCLAFLQERATNAEALFILGDFFEAWIGDDEDHPVVLQIKQSLKQLSEQGTQVAFMHGNRDFLVGEQFAADTGCQLLPEAHVIDLYGEPTLLMHGDTLCTADMGYQILRTQLRHPDWQQMFLAKSLAERREMAQALRLQSQEAMKEKAENIMDVAQEAVEARMREYGVRQLIHGHTHRPAVHEFILDEDNARRVVLADWYETGSALSATPQGFSTLPL